MKFKIGQFRQAHQKFVQDRYKELGINSISLYCAVSFCPVLAAYIFCKEIDPKNEELTKRIENVKIFYDIREVEE
jgi:coproporphyrinogen III oxidase-like Fe-S oxidoreductase